MKFRLIMLGIITLMLLYPCIRDPQINTIVFVSAMWGIDAIILFFGDILRQVKQKC